MREDIIKTERPRICTIDLKSSVFYDIESQGYNLYQGTLGSVVRVPNKTRHDSVEILLSYDFPDNFHEYDILILDLTNENRTDYDRFQLKITDTKSNSIYRLVCSYPTTIFDPRLNGNSVNEVKDGEIGIRLDKKISKGTELWTT